MRQPVNGFPRKHIVPSRDHRLPSFILCFFPFDFIPEICNSLGSFQLLMRNPR